MKRINNFCGIMYDLIDYYGVEDVIEVIILMGLVLLVIK